MILILVFIIPGLDSHAGELIRMAFAHNSRRTYGSAVSKYLQFCTSYGIEPSSMNEDTFLRFIAAMSLQQLSIRTIKVYLAGIRAWCVAAGLPDPQIYSPRVRLALRALERINPLPSKVTPFTQFHLAKALNVLSTNRDDMTLFCIMSMCYFGCMRASEICFNPQVSPPVLRRNVAFYQGNPPSMEIRVGSSKTSPQGYTLVVGCTMLPTCALCAVSSYINIYQPHPDSPLFQLSNGSYPTYSWLKGALGRLTPRLGEQNANFTPHSFRAGAATDAAARGCSSIFIKQLGRWKSEAYSGYIRPGRGDLSQMAGQLLRSVPPQSSPNHQYHV